MNDYTRTSIRQNNIEKSCIDHIATNVPAKCSEAIIVKEHLGSSDHMGITITKYTKELKIKPSTIKKRSYKLFDKERFVQEIKYTDFSKVLTSENIEEAAEEFSTTFRNVLDNHAPVKIFQTRRNYCPWLTEETKEPVSYTHLTLPTKA